MKNQGFTVKNNKPYSGGYITKYYGNIHEKCEALQMELWYETYIDKRDFGNEEFPNINKLIFENTQSKMRNFFEDLKKLIRRKATLITDTQWDAFESIATVAKIDICYLQLEYSAIKTTSNKVISNIIRMMVALLNTPYCTGLGQVASLLYQLITINIMFKKNFRVEKNGELKRYKPLTKKA